MRDRSTLLDHLLHPTNAGPMREPDGVGDGQVDVGDDLARFFLRAPEDVVVEASVETWGGGPTIVAAGALRAAARACLERRN